MADATTNSTPVVALSAQVGMNRKFKESHQGVDLVSMFEPVTKWSELIATRDAVPEMIRKAFKLAQTERPGAVYLAVPEDVEKAAAPDGARPLVVNTPRPDEPSASQLCRAADVLRSARNPVVLAGHGAAERGDLREHLGPYEPDRLSYPWWSADPAADRLQGRLSALVQPSAAAHEATGLTFARIRAAVREATGEPGGPEPEAIPMGSTEGRPRLTEPWFC